MARTQISMNQAEQGFLTEQEHTGIGNNAPHHPKGHSFHSTEDHTNVESTPPPDGSLPVYESASSLWKFRNVIPGSNRAVNTKQITTTTYTITNTDYLLVCDNNAAGGNITLYLPSVSKIDFYIVKSKSAGKVTVDASGSTINGESSIEFRARYDTVHIIGDAEWFVI